MDPRITSRRRLTLAAGLAAALVVAVGWPATQAPMPLLPTDDLYEHLTVTRHLARGDGFLCDVAYPLSFAWPFARRLPQPLVHRPPAWPVALLLPYAAVRGETGRMPAAVRMLQITFLALLAGLGTAAWARRGHPGAAAAWLPALLVCPLWPYAVDWGQAELPAAVLLLAFWLRHRDGPARIGPTDGLLVGLLAVLRPELVWLPLAWGLWRHHRAGHGAEGGRRRWLAAATVALCLVAPWTVRNARLTGDPFFSVQAAAEVVKDTRAWPGYHVYRQLEPQPAARALRDDPESLARKTARGLEFYGRQWPGLLPWPLPLLLLVGAVGARRAAKARPGTGGGGCRWPRDPETVALASLAALAAFYAPLDHSLRHLLVIVPVVAWEAAPWLGEWPWSRWRAQPGRSRRAGGLNALAALVVAVPLMLLTVGEPTGWAGAAREAVAAQGPARAEAARLKSAPADEVLFVETSAAPWLADRAAVWSPLDARTAARIRDWLSPPPPPTVQP